MKTKFKNKECGAEFQKMINEFTRLFFDAEQNQNFKTRFENPLLVKCWEKTECTRKKCPAYGSKDLRCWQIAGTHCGDSIVGGRARLLEDCKDCEVFRGSTREPTSELGELFNNMMFILETSDHTKFKECYTQFEGMVTEMSRLFFEAEKNKDFVTRFQNPLLVKCWEYTHCDRTECPAHGSPNRRCWQVAGTHCGEKPLGTHARFLEDCKECDVFKASTQDSISETGELFNNMMFILQQRMEVIKEAELVLETSVNRATTQLKESQAQLIHQEKMASVGLLASGIAHEVGNPLTSISSLVQLIQRKTEDPVSQERLSLVRKHIDRISEIVRELVDFARPSQHGAETVNVNEVVRSAIGFLKYSKQARETRLKTDLAEDLPNLFLVRDQLLQVFMNLILNAIDAIDPMKYGGVLTIRTRDDNGWIRIDFKDNGKGIPPEHLDKVFEPFFTTKDVGKGSGLGLTVSYGIIDNFKGRIEIESVVDKGSTFRIYLPLPGNTV
jgi:signal transduction histidine kinase